MTLERLAADQAHLWHVRPEAVADPTRLAALEGLLSDDERRRREGFRFPEGRHEYLVARALVRRALSRYADVAPERWGFATNAHGRPEIAAPADAPPLRFNVSHTSGLIVCLVALDRELGVDAEATDRPGDLVEIARRFFSPAEVASLCAQPQRRRRARFFELWTLKESYIKARGMGLALPLARFSFHLDEGPPRISFDAEIPDDPESWQFLLLHPDARHTLAASLRRPQRGAEVAIELREAQGAFWG